MRALGNPSIRTLVELSQVRLLPIQHAAAMKIKQPAFEPAVIPQGAYLRKSPDAAGSPPTLAVHRTLLASENVNQDAIRAITGVLMERRQEIMQEDSPSG